jgi:hypothetical protein
MVHFYVFFSILMSEQDGDTALHFAVQSGHAAVARVLITNHNAKTTIKNNSGPDKSAVFFNFPHFFTNCQVAALLMLLPAPPVASFQSDAVFLNIF